MPLRHQASCGRLVGLRTGTADTAATSYTSRYPLLDNLGSVRTLVRQDGAVSARHSYSAYGETSTLTNPDGYDNRIRYTGGYYDTATRLYKLGIRYYDPALGRFTQPDPTSQSFGHTYADDNPVNFIDPSGAHSVDYGTASAGAGNIAYGSYKNYRGLTTLASVPVVATVPVVGAVAGPAAVAYGAYQVVTGTARQIRGVRQLAGLSYCKSDCGFGGNARRFLRGVGPGQGTIDFLGGLI